MTRLMIDSGCDQNEMMQANYDYEVVPLSITIEKKSYLDGEEIALETVYDYMRQGIVPKTSQISAETMMKALDKYVAEKEDVIYLALSSELSGTYNLGYQIMQSYKEKYPELKFTAVDSKGGAGGSALIALQLLQMIEKGCAYEEIVDFAKWSADHMEYHFTVSNLEWLVKGGRLPKVAGQVGTALNIRPYLNLEEGRIEVQKLIRGEKRVFKRILKDVQNGVGEFTQQTIGISHADDEEIAKKIGEKIKEIIPEANIELFKIGAVLGPHIGIGGVGVFYYNEKPERGAKR